ncbi:hypothetical protein [Nocardioides convexus]|uniref:hypothetical protein n=1 Tax=Nocardioides convexus TaxID=2712224 RepID=UPI0024182EBF|nr:hypothetical protein [Nocardioides convexus]
MLYNTSLPQRRGLHLPGDDPGAGPGGAVALAARRLGLRPGDAPDRGDHADPAGAGSGQLPPPGRCVLGHRRLRQDPAGSGSR